jgi:hypothetical protein
LLSSLPDLEGEPVSVQKAGSLRDIRGPVHGGAFLRERRIVFASAAREFARIFVHELFHFVWLRLGNTRRGGWEDSLRRELSARTRGELGWSAEWRKLGLSGKDVRNRSRKWREYCCEAFCDTAACIYSGVSRHPEYTLSKRARKSRGRWFADNLESGRLSI